MAGKKKTTEQFIIDARAVHGDRYDYSESEYLGSAVKVKIKCEEHGFFWQNPVSHVHREQNCPSCSPPRMLTTQEFILKATAVYGNKFNYSLSNYQGATTKIKIICNNCQDMFETTPSLHIEGRGCTSCDMNLSHDTPSFIIKARKIHGDKFNYSLVNYINNKVKVKIICNARNHMFEQAPFAHLNSEKCPICFVIDRTHTKEKFIELATEIHGNTFDYSLVEYINNKTPIKIICRKNNEEHVFEQCPQTHLSGSGCYLHSISCKLTTETFIEKSKKVHDIEYDYSLTKYVTNKDKVQIICPKKHIFWQVAQDHLQGANCTICYSNFPLTTEEFIKRAKEIHYIEYDYSEVVYVNSSTKVKIKCPEHNGWFFQYPSGHLQGNKCFECHGNPKLTCESFIEKANAIFNYKYDYSEINFVDSKTPIIISCKDISHEEYKFERTPAEHLAGSGCTKCTNRYRYGIDEFLERAILKHGDLYDYSFINYINASTKVDIFCKKHNKFFKQKPCQHLDGHGCPSCSHHISSTETRWLNMLNVPEENRNMTIKIGNKRFNVDAFDVNTNTVYEFNGDYWHGNPSKFKLSDINKNNKKTFGELFQKTVEKENILKQAGYKVISIWESDFVKQYGRV